MYVSSFKHTNYISYTQSYNERHILKSTDIKLSSAAKEYNIYRLLYYLQN